MADHPLFRSEALEHYLRDGDRSALARPASMRWGWLALLACLAIIAIGGIAAFVRRADVMRARRGHVVAMAVREPRIVILVSARDRQCLRRGVPATVTIDCCPERRADVLHGLVTDASMTPDANRQYRVEVDAPGLRAYRDGTAADVTFLIAAQQRVATLAFRPLRRWFD